MTVALLGPVEIRNLAERLGVRPTKTLGQNFVHDPNSIRRIVATAGVEGERVVEIGPGLGSLTLGILEVAQSVVAVEIDPLLAGQLPKTLAQRAGDLAERVEIINEDALAVTELPGDPVTALVANLPYNVAVPVLLTFLERFASLRHGLVLVQSEVAQRLAARPGSKIYGGPSAKAAWYGEVSMAGRISRQVFWPVPNVESDLVAFESREPPVVGFASDGTPLPQVTRAEVFEVIDAAFAHRRKMLRSALADWAGSGGQAEAILGAVDIDPTLRGERLGIVDFARIAASGMRLHRLDAIGQ